MAVAARREGPGPTTPSPESLRSDRVLCAQTELPRSAGRRPGEGEGGVSERIANADCAAARAASRPLLRPAAAAESIRRAGRAEGRDRRGYLGHSGENRRGDLRPAGPVKQAAAASSCCGALSAAELVHGVALLGAELPRSRLDVLAHLLRTGGAADDARDLRLRHQPSDRQLEQRVASLARKLFELLEQIVIRPGQRPRRNPLQQRHPGALGRLGAAPILAGQETARQRKKRQDTDAKVAAGGDQFALDLAIEQVVLILRRDVGRQAAGARDPQRLSELPGGKVAAPEVTDLARMNQIG